MKNLNTRGGQPVAVTLLHFGRLVMNNDIIKNKRNKSGNQTLILQKPSKTNSFSVRLADGESWNNRSVKLAIMVVQEKYLEKLHLPQNNKDIDFCMNHVTIRHNKFIPEYEPSRHEMRIFDTLDGIVTEM
jgi:hypothetical protein